jgi:hypothetical protein
MKNFLTAAVLIFFIFGLAHFVVHMIRWAARDFAFLALG